MKNKSFKKMAILGAITTLVSMESFATTFSCPNAALGLGNTCPVVGTSGDINIIALSSNTPITSNQFGDGITADASFGNIDISGSTAINASRYGISSKVYAGNPSMNYTNYIHGNFGDINASTGIYQENFGLGTIKIDGNFNNINGNSGNGIEILSGGEGGGSDVEIDLNGATVTAKYGGIVVGSGWNKIIDSSYKMGNITLTGNIGDITSQDFSAIYLNSSGKNIKVDGNFSGTISTHNGSLNNATVVLLTSGTGEVYANFNGFNGGTITSPSGTGLYIKNDTGNVYLNIDTVTGSPYTSVQGDAAIKIETAGNINSKVYKEVSGSDGFMVKQAGANTASTLSFYGDVTGTNTIETGSNLGAALNLDTVSTADTNVYLYGNTTSTTGNTIVDTNGNTNVFLGMLSRTTGKISLGNGSDSLNMNTGADVTGVTLFDGGDDTSVADGMIDTITFNGGTYAFGGEIFKNWEIMNLDNGTNLVTSGTLTVGDGTPTSTFNGTGAGAGAVGDGTSGTGINVKNGSTIDAGNALVINGNLNIDPTSTFDGTGAGAGVYVINGNVANDGTITTLDGVVGDVVTVNGNYIAGTDSKLLFDVELGGDNSPKDSIKINGDASGASTVVINNVGGTGDATVRGIDLITVSGTNELTPTLTPGVIQAGAYEYILVKGDNGWNLVSYIPDIPGIPVTPTEPVTPTKPVVDIYRPGISNYINTAMANVNGGFAAIDAFQSGSQLGGDEVNHYQDSGHNKNLWARTYVLNESLEGKERFEYSQYLGGIQIGQDIYSNDGFEDYKHGGIFVDISEGHLNSYDRFRTLYDTFPSNSTGRTDTLARGIGAYYQYENDKGTYLDTMLLYSLLDNKYTDIYNSKSEQDGKRLSAVIGLGTNLFESNVRNWNIQLNSQLGYLKTNMNEFQDDISTIKSYSSNALRAKLGLKAYINLPETNPNSQFHNTMLYATTNIVQDLTSLKGIEVGNVTVNEKYSKTVVEAGLGIRTQARQNTEFYADIKGFSNLDSLKKTGFTGVAGVKFTW